MCSEGGQGKPWLGQRCLVGWSVHTELGAAAPPCTEGIADIFCSSSCDRCPLTAALHPHLLQSTASPICTSESQQLTDKKLTQGSHKAERLGWINLAFLGFLIKAKPKPQTQKKEIKSCKK